jgi:hypothetical protein
MLYFNTFVACIGVFSSLNLVLPWATNNIGGKTKRDVALYMVAPSGSIAGTISGHIYRTSDEPRYIRAQCFIVGIMIFNFILVLLLKLLLMKENRRRRNLSPEERQVEIVGD